MKKTSTKNIDNVNPANLTPNEIDPLYGWLDVSTGRNYWLVESDGGLLSTPLFLDDVVEIRRMPNKNNIPV